ncbi:MAG: hypothetical protein M1834_001392 [Cirrosporium novae-zelandiae]|nr:MAG: hypothetical protein M1834_001392 [Cirrosporium novae-zelandiae]
MEERKGKGKQPLGLVPQPGTTRHPVLRIPESSSAEVLDDADQSPKKRRHPSSCIDIPASQLPGSSIRPTSSASGSFGPHDSSNEGESSTMQRPAVLDDGGPPTYTPVTHRISKAKKGKKVHACQYPGCTKVFTRAEHRRYANAKFVIFRDRRLTRGGLAEDMSSTITQTQAILAKHMERHQLNLGDDSEPPIHGRKSSQASTATTESYTPPAPSISRDSPATAISRSASSINAMSIDSIVDRTSTGEYITEPIQAPYDPISNSIAAPNYSIYLDSCIDPDLLVAGIMGPSPNSSPETCPSPAAEYATVQIAHDSYLQTHRKSISSSVSELELGFSPFSIRSPASTPSNVSGDFVPTVVESYCEGLPVGTPPRLCLFRKKAQFFSGTTKNSGNRGTFHNHFPENDTENWVSGRNISTSRVILGEYGALTFPPSSNGLPEDLIGNTSHFYWCYKEYFYPWFPIVRPANLWDYSPLLQHTLIAIGTQFSDRPEAKAYSAFLYGLCANALKRQINPRDSYELHEMQAIVLLEVLAALMGRKAETRCSDHLHAVILNLRVDEDRLFANPLDDMRDSSKTELETAHGKWIELETQRRVLLAALFIDYQNRRLFPNLQDLPAGFSSPIERLPFPSHDSIWMEQNPRQWHRQIKVAPSYTLDKATLRFALFNLRNTRETEFLTLSLFQSILILLYVSFLDVQDPPPDVLPSFYPVITLAPNVQQLRLKMVYHMFSLQKFTPIHSVLIVAGESWLLSKKLVSRADFLNAKANLRTWVATDAAKSAVWNAAAILRLQMQSKNDCSDPLYDWILYISSLVCWAFGFPLRKSSLPESTYLYDVIDEKAEEDMRNYLDAMNTTSWSDVGDVGFRWQTRGLLECVRRRVAERAALTGSGTLMNEAEWVLWKLVEGRSRGSDF